MDEAKILNPDASKRPSGRNKGRVSLDSQSFCPTIPVLVAAPHLTDLLDTEQESI